MDWKARVYCGNLTATQADREVLLMGWVDAVRDHGNLLFIHLRDVSGIVQIVFDPRVSGDAYARAADLREEYVVEVRGRVTPRDPGTRNPNLKSGDIEVFARHLAVLASSKALPFRITEKAMVFGEEIQSAPEHVDEELRLRYRYLDLRRPSLQSLFIQRYEIIKCIRESLDARHFMEVETPFLTRSTPEGARDYLVPSRVHGGRFYALPQSPQLFKQLLMMSGIDRYFQIARCFRDEDLRPNRQPEFTQLDMEAAFIDEEFIYDVVEELTAKIFALGDIRLQRPFPRMSYAEAMDRYGTDRPDLRFGMSFENATDLLQETGYTVFRRIIQGGGRVKGFCVRGQASSLSKNVLQNEYAAKVVPSLGARGMSWMKVVGGRLESNIVQFFTPTEQESLLRRFGAREGDVLMMIADGDPDRVNRVLCDLRLHVARDLALVPEGSFRPLWVTEFPLFEQKDGELGSQHHPFTMPDRTDFDPTDRAALLRLNSRAYDLVVNGEELGGGSIRIHRMDMQEKIFEALGLTREQVEGKFGFFLRALEYGAPPHGGLALGLDRVIAMILKAPSIRDVIAFPKNRRAICPLTRAPSPAGRAQLEELSLTTGGRPAAPSRAAGRTAQEEQASPSAPAEKGRISRAEVKRVARLARLSLSGEETDAFRKDLNAVLEYVEALQGLETRDTPPMSHVLPLRNVWREDRPTKASPAGDILSLAPMKEDECFKVPKILEG